jgi:hypothetical protein
MEVTYVFGGLYKPLRRQVRQGCISVFFLIRTDDQEKRNALQANIRFSVFLSVL